MRCLHINSQIIAFLLIVGWFLSGCATQRVSVIEGVDYDESQHRTHYFVLPYGRVSIPGKWQKTSYNSVSRQQFFTNADSIKIAIAIGSNKYEFNPNGNLTGFAFAEAFYEWDSNYFVETYGLNRKLIEKDSTNQFLIWEIFGDINAVKIDTYFLVGTKNRAVTNCSVTITDKWSEPEKIAFLKDLFITSKEQ
jgi:hypothetical protein